MNECVILPGLGGFVTTHIAARYDDEKGVFMPPYRTLAFQTGLTTDDGILVQSYMESADLSYPEAVALVEQKVQEIKASLTTNGYYEFEHIGRLSQNVAGHYTFSASSEKEVTAPEFYGLEPLHMTELTTQPIRQPQRIEIPVERKQPVGTEVYPFYSKKGISIHFSTSTINKVAGIVIMFLLVFLFSTPFGTLKPVMSYSSFASSLLESSKPAATHKAVMTKKTTLHTDSIKVQSATRPLKDTTSLTKTTYCIVLASGVTRNNAEAFIANLAQKDIKASVLEKGRMRRVVYSSFTSKEEAQSELRSLRHSKEPFATAWVMKN